jgi:hypothetical protein
MEKFLETIGSFLSNFASFQANRSAILVHKLLNKTTDAEIREEVCYVNVCLIAKRDNS